MFIALECLVAHLVSAIVLPGLSDESGNRVATFLRLGYDMNAYPYRFICVQFLGNQKTI